MGGPLLHGFNADLITWKKKKQSSVQGDALSAPAGLNEMLIATWQLSNTHFNRLLQENIMQYLHILWGYEAGTELLFIN